MPARVAWISVAPVKALGLSNRSEVFLDRLGVRDNRRFYLIEESGRMVNGKRLGRLVQVTADYDDAAGTLALHLPGGQTVAGEVALGEPVTTDFFGRPVESRLVVGPWSEALSEWAGTPLRLARPDDAGGGVDRGHNGGVSLVSTASLEALARAAGIDGPVDGRRFRMLFGVEGTEAHEEDSWLGHRIRIGDAAVVLHGNVGRCAVTTQNPETGVRDFDTLGVLEAYRGELPTSEPLPFGVWGQVAKPGRVALGDPVHLE